MEDASLEAPPADTLTSNAELPVNVDSIAIDGIAPEVGDQVEVKVGGAITRVVNGVAYLRPETVNDTPLPASALNPSPEVDETDRLRSMSQMADSETSY